MKKLLAIILSIVILAGLTACGKKSGDQGGAPQLGAMRNICQLATMKCYYHNVAKFKQEDAERFLWMTKDKNFWIEYSGIVTIGIDASQVKITVDGDKVSVTVPPAQVLESKVDKESLNKEAYIIAEDSAKVTAEDQSAVFKTAQEAMEKSAAQDSLLLANGRQRAVDLLENYIHNMGEQTGKTYEIEWIYLDSAEVQGQAETENTTAQ